MENKPVSPSPRPMRKFRLAVAFADNTQSLVDVNAPTLIAAAAQQVALMASESKRIIAWTGQEIPTGRIIVPNGRVA